MISGCFRVCYQAFFTKRVFLFFYFIFIAIYETIIHVTHRYNDVMQDAKSRARSLDDVLSRWRNFEKEMNVVRQFIDK